MPSRGEVMSAAESAGLCLLAAAALQVLMVALLVVAGGPAESKETLSWVLAFAVAIPAGFWLAGRYQDLLGGGAAATARSLALGVGLLTVAFCLRRFGDASAASHALLALAAAGALAAPVLAARLWAESDVADVTGERLLVVACLFAIFVLFVPEPALAAGRLGRTLILAALLLGLLWLRPRVPLPRPARSLVDLLACGLIVAVGVHLPELVTYAPNLVYHQGFFLGPANEVLHGHAMLNEAWSQYGVGMIDALGLFFELVPIGFGTLSLLTIGLTVAQVICLYAILRLAGAGLLISIAAIAVAVAGNLFYTLETYISYPSTGPLRFGLPYLIILLAVARTRFPRFARAAEAGALVVLAVAAAWSFETLTYAAGAYAALLLVEAIAAGGDPRARLLRGFALGAGACLAGVATLTLLTLALQGQAEWWPYLEFLKAYSAGEVSSIAIDFFSAGPLMAAAIFASAVVLLWIARNRPRELSPPLAAALAGLTGLAIATFTYYLGRSHPNNLLVLLAPVAALGGLWLQALTRDRLAPWRLLGAAAISFAMAMVAVASWPSVSAKWETTALSKATHGSLGAAYRALAENPPLDPRAPLGVEMLDRYLPPGEPALVVAEPELSTEVLMRAGRRNLLPIAHAPEDVLIESSFDRARAAAAAVPAGTAMLVSRVDIPEYEAVSPAGQVRALNLLQDAVLDVLRRRFEFKPLLVSRDAGIRLVRLVPRRSGG